MIRVLFAGAVGGLALLATAVPASAQVAGVWRNERGSVDVRIGPCGGNLCGVVVRASPQAIADAQAGGVDRLIGTQLLENYQSTGGGAWSGTVFVPDMGRRFSSTLEQLGPNQLRVSGCLFAGYMCRSETWTRVAVRRR